MSRSNIVAIRKAVDDIQNKMKCFKWNVMSADGMYFECYFIAISTIITENVKKNYAFLFAGNISKKHIDFIN